MAKRYLPISVKKTVFDRANGRCEYCRSPFLFSTEPYTIEHIIPKSKGGDHDLNNLALSCFGCNLYKATKMTALDKITMENVPVFNPRTMQWNQQFTWSEHFNEIIGLTAIGRATIDALQLNRKPLKNLRTALVAIGEHPPG